MSTSTRQRRPMASIFLVGDGVPFVVAETPHEIADLIRQAMRDGEPLIELTLASSGDWNGKTFICRADQIAAASPPAMCDCDEDDD